MRCERRYVSLRLISIALAREEWLELQRCCRKLTRLVGCERNSFLLFCLGPGLRLRDAALKQDYVTTVSSR